MPNSSSAENNTAAATSPNLFNKLAGFQAVIPEFDNISAVTPQYLIDTVERITSLASCTDEEKLLVLRTRIRGDALSHIIGSPDLSRETDYERFKEKFLAFFEQKLSLATRQQQFSNCRMQPNESVKLYAARICAATMKFFNNPDLANDAVNTLFEQSKLSKFLEGLLPTYRQATLLRDPQTFSEALNYVELLQANEKSFSDPPVYMPSVINNTAENFSQTSNTEEIKNLLQAHASQTRESISALAKEVENIKISQQKSADVRQPRSQYRDSFHQKQRDTSSSSRRAQRFPCEFCNRTNHDSQSCYFRPGRGNNRSQNNGYARYSQVGSANTNRSPSRNYVGQRPVSRRQVHFQEGTLN